MGQKIVGLYLCSALAAIVVIAIFSVSYWQARSQAAAIKVGDSIGRLAQYRKNTLPDTTREIVFPAERNHLFVDFIKDTAQYVDDGRKNALFSLCEYSSAADFCCPTDEFPPIQYQATVFYIPTSHAEEGKPSVDYNNVIKIFYSNSDGVITKIIDGMTINDYTLSKEKMQQGLTRCKSI